MGSDDWLFIYPTRVGLIGLMYFRPINLNYKEEKYVLIASNSLSVMV